MAQDRRNRKTQNAIKEIFLKLLQKHSFYDITVQQIADLADINRGTFYFHYVDKYDLLEKMENEKINDIQTFITEQNKNAVSDSPKDIVHNIMAYLIEHIDHHLEFYKTMFNIGQVSMLQEKLYQMIFDHLSSYKNINNTIGDIPLLYFTSYVSGAGISFIKHWIQDENRIDKSHLIKHFTTIVNNGPVPLMEKEQFPK